jgi:hypothetical protein
LARFLQELLCAFVATGASMPLSLFASARLRFQVTIAVIRGRSHSR